MKLRRWLYLTHRWLGILLCLLVAMWFFSGVVMMYVGFPELTRDERLAGLPPLDRETLRVGPAQLLAHLDPAQTIEELRLTPVLGRPAWLLRIGDGAHHGLFADTGEVLSGINIGDAIRAGEVYSRTAGISSDSIEHPALLEIDQWSVSSSLHPHRPLHLLALNDPAGTELYISSVTGEVIRDTTALERGWNWLGANLHWIYPLQLRRHSSAWHWVVVVLSLAGLVSIVSGAIVGLLRLRLRRRYRGTDITPYRGAMKLHHILGLVVLIPLTTYMLSGLLSMNPWGVFNDDIPFSERLGAYRETPIVREYLTDTEAFALSGRSLDIPPDTRELIWHWLGGLPHLYAVTGDGQRQLLVSSSHDSLETSALAQIQQVMAGHKVSAIEWLTAYDSYYYSHHQRWLPLPVMRVRFDDPAATWVHIDLTTGELINQLTRKGRTRRWLYNGLHSLDFHFLIANRPSWDLVVIALSTAGFLFSSTAVLVAWRRLFPRRKPCPKVSSRRTCHTRNQRSHLST